MRLSVSNPPEPTLAALVAAEDLQCGDVIALLNEVYEYPSFLWLCDGQMTPPDQPVRIRWRARQAGRPLKVVAICLPFVFVETPARRCRTIDVRRCECVRLHRDYARMVWKRLRRKQT